MQILIEISFVLLMIVLGSCSSTNHSDNNVAGKLDGLIVTWVPPGVHDPRAFKHLPRTKEEAIAQNCTELDNCCQNPSSHYTGIRYICNDTVDAIIIYDVKGKVAGIQVAFLKKAADKQVLLDYEHYSSTQEETILGEKYYVVTAYFIDPHRICVGRSEEEFYEEGTVTNVYFQYGSDPIRNSTMQPLYGDNSTLMAMGWKDQQCYPNMGLHYTQGPIPEHGLCECQPICTHVRRNQCHEKVDGDWHHGIRQISQHQTGVLTKISIAHDV